MVRPGTDITHGDETACASFVITLARRRARRRAESDAAGWVPCQLRMTVAGHRGEQVDQAMIKVHCADREKRAVREFFPLSKRSCMLCASREPFDVLIVTSRAALSGSNDLERGHHV